MVPEMLCISLVYRRRINYLNKTDKRDYLILTNGRAVLCLAIDTAIGLLNEMELDVSSAESARQELYRGWCSALIR